MYVAGVTKHHNRAICIRLTNAHNWDHIRRSFLFEGISRIGGFICQSQGLLRSSLLGPPLKKFK